MNRSIDMKNIILTLSFLVALTPAKACDVCGGAVNSAGGDVIPGIFRNFIGLNANFRSFTSTHLTLFEDEIPIVSYEHFNSFSLTGRYSPIRRLQFLANVPVSLVSKEMEGEERNTWGISDASLRVNYLLIDRKNEEKKTFLNLFLGSSVKAPTGRNNFRENEEFFFHRNMLPGSGTLDFGAHVDVLWRKKDMGLTFNGSSLFRGAVGNSYDFGNLYTTRLSGFRFFNVKKSKLMLDIGAEFAANGQDRDLYSNTAEDYTGGWMISPSLRMNYFYKDFIFSVTAQRPLAQNLADGQVLNNYALQTSVIYLFKTKQSK